MTSPLITVPQNPVTGGESGHLSDHDHIASGLLALWQCLPEGAIDARISSVSRFSMFGASS